MLTRPSTGPSPAPLALRLREAARLVGVSPNTLRAWTLCGDVPHFRRGRVLLFPLHALRRWLDAQVQQHEEVGE